MEKRVNRTNQRVNSEILRGRILRLEAGSGRLEVLECKEELMFIFFDSKNMSNEA